jgi:hypothetical protein
VIAAGGPAADAAKRNDEPGTRNQVGAASVDDPGVIDADDDGGPAGQDDDGEQPLGGLIDPARFPILAMALSVANARELRRELVRLFAPQLTARAPRRAVRTICRLEGPRYDEPVLVKDISLSGVRFLVQADVPLDLARFGNMHLHARMASGPRALEVALVRRCGGDERHTDLAWRFVSPAADHAQVVAEIRSQIFGETPPTADAAD